MTDRKWINELFATIDNMDSEGFAAYITPEGTFQWGSYPRVTGTEDITNFVTGFFSMIKSLSHNITGVWHADGDPDTVFVRGETLYTTPGGEQVTLTFLNLFLMDGKLVKDYTVYADPSPLNEALAKQ